MTRPKTHFDPILLGTFLAVVEARNFSEAGRRLRLRQSTVSQHIARLEFSAGRRLIVRNTHGMSLTADGQAMVGFAQGIVEAQERARRYFSRSRSDVEGGVRLGAGGNFGLFILPKILPKLRMQHPLLNIEVRIGTPAVLHKELEDGDLDLIVMKYRPGEGSGQRVRREKLVWVGRDALVTNDTPIPLVLLDPPSTTRSIVIEALEGAGRSWRISCTSGNANGLRAAVLAGLGVAVQSDSMLAPELADMVLDCGLPELGCIDYAVVWPQGGGSRTAKLLAQAIFAAGRR